MKDISNFCCRRACPTKPRSDVFVENLIANFIENGAESIKFTPSWPKMHCWDRLCPGAPIISLFQFGNRCLRAIAAKCAGKSDVTMLPFTPRLRSAFAHAEARHPQAVSSLDLLHVSCPLGTRWPSMFSKAKDLRRANRSSRNPESGRCRRSGPIQGMRTYGIVWSHC